MKEVETPFRFFTDSRFVEYNGSNIFSLNGMVSTSLETHPVPDLMESPAGSGLFESLSHAAQRAGGWLDRVLGTGAALADAGSTLRGRLMLNAPLAGLIACSGTGIVGENDIATSGYCGLASADSTDWPGNLSLVEGDGVVGVQPEVEKGALHVDSNGSWLLKIFLYPDAEFTSGFVFDANFDPEKDVTDETDDEGVRTITLKTVIPFEYKGDEYKKDATFLLVSPDEGATMRLTMQESPIIDGQFQIDLVTAVFPEVETTEDTAEPPEPPTLLEVCEGQLLPGEEEEDDAVETI